MDIISDTLDVVQFIDRFGEKATGRLDITPADVCYLHHEAMVKAGQYIWVIRDKKPVGLMTYYKLRNAEDVREVVDKHGTWILPDNFTQGNIIYVQTIAVDYEYRRKDIIRGLIKMLLLKEPEAKLAFWINTKNRWNIVRREHYEK